jgi:RNA polymerase sigma-70 factor (ECF subfamily)
MSLTKAQLEKLTREGAARLLARAGEARSLSVEVLAPRVERTLEKYLLRDEPDAAPEVIAKFFDDLHADDLCLAVACERSDEAAWTDWMARGGAPVPSAARSASANAEAAEELTQSIWAELYGLRTRTDESTGGKLAHYSGRGSLGGWLRAVVGQLAIDRHRQSARYVQMESEADGDRSLLHGQETAAAEKNAAWLSASAPDPERALAANEASAHVHEALARVLRELAAEDRLLIKLYYLDNLRLREAGAVLGVHEATASRRLTALHKELRRRVGAILISQHGWTEDEVTRSLAETASHLQSDLGRLLAPDQVAEEAGVPSRTPRHEKA